MNPLDVQAEIDARHAVLNDKMKRWQRGAACKDAPLEVQAAFIAERPKNAILAARMEEPAKAVCETCPVRKLCLEHALMWPETAGIWGGLNYVERTPLMKARGIHANADGNSI